MYDVTALGELIVDFSPVSTGPDGFPTLAAHPGGAPGNFLATLARYGAKTAFLGKVGEDAFGHLMKNALAANRIDTKGIVTDPSVFTTLAFVTLDKSGDRSFSFARKPGADTCLTWEEVDAALIDNAKLFHFGTLSLTDDPSRSATVQAVAYAKARGKLVTFDPNYRPPLWPSEAEAKRWMLWGLEQADVVKLGDGEVDFLWGCAPEEGADRALALGAKLVMVTLGPQGCLLKTAAARAALPSPQVRPVDTTGAGDIFGGAAVSQLLKLGKAPQDLTEEDLRTVASFAVTAASLSTETHGGIPSIPAYETVLAHITP